MWLVFITVFNKKVNKIIENHLALLVFIFGSILIWLFFTGNLATHLLNVLPIYFLDNYFKYEIELGIAYEHDTNPNDILDINDLKEGFILNIEPL